MGSVAEDKPTPMSDPISRKSPSKHENNVLLDFLAPSATASMVQSNSAPNLAEMGGKAPARPPPPGKDWAYNMSWF